MDGRNASSATALHFAALHGRVGCVRLLLEAGASAISVDASDVSVLACSAFSDSADQVAELLLAAGAHPDVADEDGDSVAHEAARWGRDALLRRLLELAPELVDAETGCGWTPLHTACVHGRAGAVRVLLEAGADTGLLTEDGDRAAALWPPFAPALDADVLLLLDA